ncbi:MAG: cytochrome c3 family protein [Spirochaetes bacterium]|nr:cytochrome c3 family protein [Spirochaetota bacterium]
MVFPGFMNKVPMAVLAGALGLGAALTAAIWYWGGPKHTEVGYSPKQPIPFSHRVHAGDLGMDCRFCHNTVERTAVAPLPSGESCMSCHAFVKKDSEGVKRLAAAVAKNEAIPWVRVHRLPDYARFHHGVHVQAGVSCLSCHGRIDQMTQVRQVEPLSMSWCLDCHRKPEAQLRPAHLITRLDAVIPDPVATGRRIMESRHLKPSTDCSACHQ